MNNREINEKLAALALASMALEEMYIENGGEVTEETQALETEINAVRDLLTTTGVDALGRWLKGKEDERKQLKAEKDYLAARIRSVENTIDYIKEQIGKVLRETGCEKMKGIDGYSFTQSVSTKSALRSEALDEAYLDMVTEAARNAGLPSCIDVALKTTASRLIEAGEDYSGYVETTSEESVTFRKPRSRKEE